MGDRDSRSKKLTAPITISATLLITVWIMAKMDWKKDMMVLKMEVRRLERDSKMPAILVGGVFVLAM